MIKILFVCHGNICRSPMAEFVMKDIVKKEGLENQITIASAATSNEEIGNPPHRGTKAKLREHGIRVDGKYAIRITEKDYDKYDYLIGMDQYNISNMKRIWNQDPENKVHLLLEYAGRMENIADPWYTGDFDLTYQDVLSGCKGLLKHIQQEN